ncbi:MAG: endolytic transglycosylase MltG [Clostridia bacterium]|nr:endolytic transglycosylase MltG [Clostridia bacterium]
MDNFNIDDFKIENGFEIKEEQKPVIPEKKPSGSKKALKTVILVVSIVVVSLAIAFGAIYAGADYLGIGFGRGGNCSVEIEKGSPSAVIADRLGETGAVKIPLLFRVYSKIKGYDSQYKYGVYNFDSELGYEGIANMLMTEGAEAESVTVTVVEGFTVDDIANLLEKKKVCEKTDFYDALQNGNFEYDFIRNIPVNSVHYRFEGYLFPDTYNFYNYDSKECAYLAVDKMLSTMDKKLKEAKIDINGMKIGKKDYSLHEILSLASIIELESNDSKDEMANVAAVFINRLESENFKTLGSSPTRKYPYGSGRYNTYECEGLPVGPLCSPGIFSVKAAVSPTKNFDYFYFVTDKKMNFYYKKTLEEHNSIIAKLKAENNWIYED